MPSDPRVVRAFELLAAPIAAYRAALAATLEEVRGHLESGRSDANGRTARLEEQLGVLGGSRIDVSRMSALLGQKDALDAASLKRLQRASDSLRNLVSRGDALFEVVVPPGADTAAAVRRQLGQVGRAFAAARVAMAAQKGGPSGLNEESALDHFPFAEWNAAERRLAPPLVVTVTGAELVAGSLVPLVDGSQKLLVIVDGLCSPAPLVRLITPGVLVIQAHEMKDLERIAAWPGPAVGALVPIWAARFAHDPSAGPESWQRMSVHLERDWRSKRIGSLSAEQQMEELRQLQALATKPAVTAPIPGAPPLEPLSQIDPADRLAAWLLQQAQLTEASH